MSYGPVNDGRYGYGRLELFLSDRSRMEMAVEDPGSRAISISTPTADEPEGPVVVVRRLAQSEPGRPGPPNSSAASPGRAHGNYADGSDRVPSVEARPSPAR